MCWLHDDETTKVTKDDIFKEDAYHLKEIANKLQKTIDKLTQFKAWALSRANLWSVYMYKESMKERKKERREQLNGLS